MWPFSSNKKPTLGPAILIGEISVHWNKDFNGWEFSDGEYVYSLADQPMFDTAILEILAVAKEWLVELDSEIETEIEKHLQGWCEWTGEKHVVGIDVSRLMSHQEIDVSYAGGEEWGDLGINIVITGGRVTSSYAGD